MAFQLSAFGYQPPRLIDSNRFIVVRTPEQFEYVMRASAASPYLVFDFETNGLAWYLHARACGIALGFRDGHVHRNAYIPFRHRTGEPQLDATVVLPALRRLLALPMLKIGHNIKFDLHIARCDGIEVDGPLYDTFIASVLFDENSKAGLKERATWLLDRDAGFWEDEVDRHSVLLAKQHRCGKEKYLSRHGYAQHPIALIGPYACYDSEYTFGLYCLYEHKFSLSSRYERVFTIEMDLVRALLDMESEGVLIDAPYLEHIRAETSRACDELDVKIRQLTFPYTVDVGSDEKLRDYLRGVLKLPLTEFTKNTRDLPPHMRKLAVGYDALAPFRKEHPFIDLTLKRRDAEKLRSTYTDSLLSRLDPHSILRCEFKQVGTNTGRMSSADPNLQNIASDSDERALLYSGKKVEDGGVDPWSIKRAFKVPEGYVRLFADYSQIELRVMAYYSRDPIMTEAYLTGEDLHARAMREINRPRRVAKVMNFGLAYCLTPEGLARQAEISLEEANAAYGTFSERYATLFRFREMFWARCRLDGNQFQNLWGRPRRLDDLQSPEKGLRKRAERQAIGSLIQGTAAELTKESLVRIHKFMKSWREKLDAKLCLTVHDEIQADVARHQKDWFKQAFKHYMEDYNLAPIPIVVDIAESTTTWADKGH